ncbi:uncharacterized protein [Panulirus ornatus]|uniref:uncharacterized protein isoform X2 n=1 Tax=Panulirus ornatus TaxID=150431 RepID=UPI003A83F596
MARDIIISVFLLSLAFTASAQLAPVYNPDGEIEEPIVEATPIASLPLPTAVVPAAAAAFVTKTVYGFLDFTTTVGSTVMIFTPQSQSAKPKLSKTRSPLPATTRTSLNVRQSSRFTPTPTVPKVTATIAPSTQPPSLRIHTSSTLESSFFEPHSALAIEELFSATPKVEVYEEVQDEHVGDDLVEELPAMREEEEEEQVVTEPPKPARTPTNFRRTQKLRSGSGSTGSRRRLDLNFFTSRKKVSAPRRPFSGSTIVPITIEGTGTLTKRITTTKEPFSSSVPVTTPSEVIVSAVQGFASLSVLGPFSTAVNNELGQVSEHYDFLASAPTLDVQESFDVYEVEPTAFEDLYSSTLVSDDVSFPTGLVTKLGGTIVSDGLTTVHETSVIGTYIGGQYAQVLMSTSHIFHTTPREEIHLASPSLFPDYETVKSVIKGSATQFINPETTSSLPLESLFSAPPTSGRDSRRNDEDEESLIQSRLRSALSKRRGANHDSSSRTRARLAQDPYVDEEEEHDLQRAGSNLRPSFRFQGATSVKKTPAVSTFYAQTLEPTTYRPRFKPSATRRHSGGRSPIPRATPSGPRRQGRPTNRWRLGSSPRPKSNINRRPLNPIDRYDEDQYVLESTTERVSRPTPAEPINEQVQEETLQVVTSTPADGATEVLLEVATIRSLHTFRVGTTKNTRYVTFTKTVTHSIEGTSDPSPPEDQLYQTQLFENILDDGPRDVSTLPPVDLGANDISAVLETVTETFSTTEIMKKTSVLPVLHSGETSYHTLTQTYHITRVVTAHKTMPPFEAFSFIPENSLNEFNGQLLAEGTENDESLLPGEVEYDENGEVVDTTSGTRVRPPPGFPIQDPNLAELAGGQFNPEVFEKQLHPQLAAALQQRQQLQQQQQQKSPAIPQLASGQITPQADPAVATPGLTPEQLQQLAYLRLINPYGFGGFPSVPQQPQTTVSSTPVTVVTDITTTSTSVFRVIFNARPILTTISSVEVIQTTLTTYSSTTLTVSPTLPAFPFLFPPSPFPVG